MGGAGPLVEMSTASSPEWDKDLNRNFKATSVSSTPPPSSQSLGCVMVNKPLLKWCVCVCMCVCNRHV